MPAYFEETDFCFQLRHKQGKEVYYTGFSEVYHYNGVSYNGKSKKKSDKERKKNIFAKNKGKFYSKWSTVINSIAANTVEERIIELYNNKVIVFFHNTVPKFDIDLKSKRIKEIMEMYVKRGFLVSLVINDKNDLDEDHDSSKYIQFYRRLGICVFHHDAKEGNYIYFLKKNFSSNSSVWFCSLKAFRYYYNNVSEIFLDGKFIYDMIDIYHLKQDEKSKSILECYKNVELKLHKKIDYIVVDSYKEKTYMNQFYNKDKLIIESNIHHLELYSN